MSLSQRTKARIFLGLGWSFFALGIVGVFLPIVPTTPFMIVAAACFDRGSPKFHHWLVNHNIFGPPIQDWHRSRAIRPKFKIMAAVAMASSAGLVWYMGWLSPVWQIAYAVVLLLILLFIATRNNS